MCGIVAVVSADRLEPEILDAMRDRLAHRGPDGARSWLTETPRAAVGLGHRRLSIIDLTRDADQPMFDASGDVALVYNGEIYNYVELRDELTAEGRTFATESDTEVLIAAYERWGVDCLPRLNGMFAFALWDGRRRELFLARDRFGEKPLFYTPLAGGGYAFASEMKALFAHPGVQASPNESVVADYISGNFYEDGEETMFEGVVRLPPSNALVIGDDGAIRRRWRYWTPDYSPIEDGYDEAAAVQRFRKLLEQSVRMRLRSDVPVGTSLSGGLDSSAIVCLLAETRMQTPTLTQNTFSGRFDRMDPTLSEGPYIDLVAKRTGVNAHGVTPTPLGLIEESERLHWHQEEPFLSASIYLQWCVMRLAHEHRTTVLLDGQGADELLAGYQFYFPAYQLDLLDRRRLGRLAYDTVLFRRRLRRASRGYPDSLRRFNHDVALGPRALAGSWRSRSGVAAGRYAEGVPEAVPGMRLRRQLAEALQYNSLPMLLRYADRNAMAFSRETRFPFLDHELVDCCVRLPDRAFIRDGWQKHILRQATRDILPSAIRLRADKVGYAAPLDLWLRGALRDWAHERLFTGAIVDLDGYDRSGIEELWRRHQDGENHSWALWRWISLNEWFALLDSGAWRRGPAPATPSPTVEAG
ncbi:MAG TPA: asparagine synthase (glutamine-hydrolyzing) [Acidimicrobiales bacterium]|nr:asparagine synthase (glutamine-hydrolyzing) [Acidimicrobiales bacterium]